MASCNGKEKHIAFCHLLVRVKAQCDGMISVIDGFLRKGSIGNTDTVIVIMVDHRNIRIKRFGF